MLRIIFLMMITLYFLMGCTPYKKSTLALSKDLLLDINGRTCTLANEQGLQHPLYAIIPRHRSQIQWYAVGHWTTWAFFGNDDDGIFGETSKNEKLKAKPIGYQRAFAWWLRNPLHNFCYYVIGTAYRTNSQLVLIRVVNGREFIIGKYWSCPMMSPHAKRGSSFYLGLHGWKPFISFYQTYQIRGSKVPYKSDFYVGWRRHGSFGLKCIIFSKQGLREMGAIQDGGEGLLQ